jgi:transmembrane sensor
MTREWFDDAERDPIHETAADWFTRLQDPHLSLDDTLNWQSWIAADERHARAFHRIEETWQRFRGLPRPQLMTREELGADLYDGSVPIRDHADTFNRVPAQRTRFARRSVARLALAASFIAAVIGASAIWYLNNSGVTFETAVGENRRIHLEDGSSVTLGGHTRVKVAFESHVRHLTLERGEALFTVAKDPSRPFSVRAGSALVTAVGTAFNVRRTDDRVVVAVVEGRVIVEPKKHAATQRPKPLNAGDSATIGGAGIESSQRLQDSATAIAWQTGRLAFEREPLRYVLDDVNRYAAKPIEMGDESVGNLKITGTVLSDNIDGWVASLESAFELRVIDEGDRIVLKRKP